MIGRFEGVSKLCSEKLLGGVFLDERLVISLNDLRAIPGLRRDVLVILRERKLVADK